MKKHLKSLREYIEALKAIGELQEIDPEVDWNLEMGAIARRCYETGAPAPLFNTIKGIESGFRVLGAPAGVSRQPTLYLSRIAVSLGLPPTASGKEIIEALVEARSQEFIAPKLVDRPHHAARQKPDDPAWGVPNAAEIVYLLRQTGFPVAMAWSPLESANHLYAIAIDRNWRQQLPDLSAMELCRQIGDALYFKSGIYFLSLVNCCKRSALYYTKPFAKRFQEFYEMGVSNRQFGLRGKTRHLNFLGGN